MYTSFIFYIIVLFAGSSCTIALRPPIAATLIDKIKANKEMDTITKKGLFDGCFTGYHSRGNSYLKSSLYFRQDPTMASNTKYTFAWGRGYVACFSEANIWSYMPVGGKIINPKLMQAISPVNEQVSPPIGNDSASRPAVWYFDESINRGLPGTANYGTNHNFFGIFGSCFWC